jgi:hypothetical protein
MSLGDSRLRETQSESVKHSLLVGSSYLVGMKALRPPTTNRNNTISPIINASFCFLFMEIDGLELFNCLQYKI